MEEDIIFSLWNLIVGLVLFCAIGFNLYRYRLLEKRRRLFQQLAMELGSTVDDPRQKPDGNITGIPDTSRWGKIVMTIIIFVVRVFGPQVSLVRSELLGVMSNLSLFTGFKSMRIENLIIKDSKDARVYLFEGSWKSKTNRTYNRTGFAAKDARFDFPEFTVVPEDFAKKATKLLGSLGVGDKDIKIEFDPEFSESYFVTGAEEHRVREVLNAGTCRWFMTNKAKGLHFESNGPSFVIYVEKKSLDIETIRALYLAGDEFLQMWEH